MTNYGELSVETLRALTLEALQNFNSGKSSRSNHLQAGTLVAEINEVAAKKGLKPKESADPNARGISDKEYERIGEIVSELISEGIAMWGFQRGMIGPPHMRITEYGKKVLESGKIIPHDPQGFLNSFNEEVPEANKLVRMYLEESVDTYRHNHLFSSSVMLGVAAEAAFYDLFNRLKSTLTNPDKQKKFMKLEKDISLKNKFDETLKEINNFRTLLPPKLQESIESNIKGIFTLIRNQRNDSGHPTGKLSNKNEIFAYQLLFKMYCEDLYSLISWLEKNPTWEKPIHNKSNNP